MHIPKSCLLHKLCFALVLLGALAGPAAAHHTEGGPPQWTAPAATEPIEVVTGAVEQLIVENRVTGVTIRYVSLRLDDGSVAALKGEGLDSLPKGARVQASGRLAGDTLFVTEARVVATASAQQAVMKTQATKQVQGTLALVHGDDFARGVGSYAFVVRGDDGRATPLKLAVLPETLKIGMQVVATGSAAADGLSLDTENVAVLALPMVNGPIAQASNNSTLVLLVKFSDSPASDPFTQAQVNQMVNTNSNSVVSYYNEVSYGQHTLTATVTNWLTMSMPIPATCDWMTIGSSGDAAATAAGYNLGSYQNRFYIFPQLAACGWAGLAYVGYGQAWNNGYYSNLLVFTHELGHNFGLLHPANLSCPGQVIGGPCSSAEYGDPFDIMGNGSTMHFNAMQKSRLSWIPAASVQTHSSGSVNYTLSPIESGGGVTYAVKIPATATRTYWVEYRQPLGLFDVGVPNNGAQVRVSSPYDSICGGCADDTEILATGAGSTLNVGQTFVDRATGVTINPTLQDAAGLHVTVSKVNLPMLGDFDNDGSSDILWQSPSTAQGAIWFMKLGALSSSSNFSLPPGWIPQAVGDVNGDGKADIIWTNPGSNLVAIWFMNGSTHGTPPDAFFGVPNTWTIAAVGDFNGDGRTDILWRNINGQIATWFMNGSTIQSVVYYNNVDASWTVLGTGDFFGDGKSEVVWKHQPDGTIYLWRNADQPTPQLISLGAPGGTWQVAAIGDFNGDGKADLFLRDALGTNAIWPAGLSSGAVFPPGVPTSWSVSGAKQLYGEGRSNVLWRGNTGVVAQWRFDTSFNATGTFLTTVPLNWSQVGQ